MSEHFNQQDGVIDPSSAGSWNGVSSFGVPVLPPEMEGFQLCNPIGRGATGTVFRSVQTKEFAVKVVPWRRTNARKNARREYETARLFAACDKTVHALACYEYDSCSFILQEIGEPIIDCFSKDPCTLRRLLQALLDISEALRFIHSKGYTHFDVKPGNILIIGNTARLGDFSHCLRHDPDRPYQKPMGTRAYMAPEIVPGAGPSGLEDMYSLGVTMYVLLMAGSLPFEDRRNQAEKKEIRSLFIHPDLLSVIQKATACDPADRYQTFEDFSKHIRSFMDSNKDQLDETVPTYLSPTLRERTLSPFSDESTASLDL